MFETFSAALEANGLYGLFCICFLAATILPLSSELVFVLFLTNSSYSNSEIFIVACIGNCLGGFTNFVLGYIGNKLVPTKTKKKALQIASKHGFYAAFFSWIPFIGDPILVALGYLKASFWKTMTFMCLGKCLRYLLLMGF